MARIDKSAAIVLGTDKHSRLGGGRVGDLDYLDAVRSFRGDQRVV